MRRFSLANGASFIVKGGLRIAANLVVGKSASIGGGGALLQNGSKIVVTSPAVDSVGSLAVVSNIAREGDGGGLALLSGSSVELGMVCLENNEAPGGRGGGLFAHGNASLFEAGNTKVRRNNAREGGGVTVISGAVIETPMLEAEQNVATTDGGGIMLSGRTSRITVAARMLLAGNKAGGDGGALELTNGSTIDYGAFTCEFHSIHHAKTPQLQASSSFKRIQPRGTAEVSQSQAPIPDSCSGTRSCDRTELAREEEGRPSPHRPLSYFQRTLACFRIQPGTQAVVFISATKLV